MKKFKDQLPKTLWFLAAVLALFIAWQRGSLSAAASTSEEHAYLLSSVDEAMVPEVQTAVDSLQDGEMLTVILRLRSQANLAQIADGNRGDRIRQVIMILQNQANATQNRLRAFLEQKKNEGLVSEYQTFWVFNGLAVTATAEVIAELAARPEIETITPNEIDIVPTYLSSSSNSETNIAVVNAPGLWDLGYRGQGIVVANMDSGVDYTHPDLNGRWRGGSNSWYDPYGQHPTIPTDLTGHGTWTMGVMVGGDAGGTAIGVAPEAQWIAVKIFNDAGGGTATAIHAGYQWLLDPDGNTNTVDTPHVVNNSWTYSSADCNLEFELDLQALRAAGILPIFAAGNAGPSSATSRSPANNPSAFAVGATTNADAIYFESSRGPSACGETGTIFPELVAPGVDIRTSDFYGSYYNATGTSLAAPHVAGALALLLSADSDWPASYQQDALLNSAVDLGSEGADNEYGYGRLDIGASYQWLQGVPTPTPTPVLMNLALNQPVIVSSSQTSSYDGAKAVDGDLNTFWKTKKVNGNGGPSSEWIMIDLGNTTAVTQILLSWHNYFATSYSIELSDDNINWNSLYNTTSGDGSLDYIMLNNATGRYLRVITTAWSNNTYRNWLKEIEIYGDPGQPMVTPTPTPTSTPVPTPSPPPPSTSNMHVSDLDGSSRSFGQKWKATVYVSIHDGSELPVANAEINGIWSGGFNGPASCVTDSNGYCSMDTGFISGTQGSVAFSVDNVVLSGYAYDPTSNHEPDNDSDGTTITVTMP